MDESGGSNIFPCHYFEKQEHLSNPIREVSYVDLFFSNLDWLCSKRVVDSWLKRVSSAHGSCGWWSFRVHCSREFGNQGWGPSTMRSRHSRPAIKRKLTGCRPYIMGVQSWNETAKFWNETRLVVVLYHFCIPPPEEKHRPKSKWWKIELLHIVDQNYKSLQD